MTSLSTLNFVPISNIVMNKLFRNIFLRLLPAPEICNMLSPDQEIKQSEIRNV